MGANISSAAKIGGVAEPGFVHGLGKFGVVRVESGQSAVVTRFGLVVRTLSPGISFYVPFVHRVTPVRLASEVLKLKMDAYTGTQQPLKLDVRVVARPRYDHLEAFFVKNADPTAFTLAAIGQSLMREVRARGDIGDLLHDLPELTASAAERVRVPLRDAGIEVESVLIDDVIVPDDVKRAMAGVVAAQRERDARNLRTDAEVYERVSLAKAKAEEDAIRARGVAEARAEVARGMREAVDSLEGTGVSAEFLMQWTLEQDKLRTQAQFAGKAMVFMGAGPFERTSAVHAHLLGESAATPAK